MKKNVLLFEQFSQLNEEAERAAHELGEVLADIHADVVNNPETEDLADEVEEINNSIENPEEAKEDLEELKHKLHSRGGSAINTARKVVAALALISTLASCSITRDNGGFHIGRAYRSEGGGCGAWHPGGGFRRR